MEKINFSQGNRKTAAQKLLDNFGGGSAASYQKLQRVAKDAAESVQKQQFGAPALRAGLLCQMRLHGLDDASKTRTKP